MKNIPKFLLINIFIIQACGQAQYTTVAANKFEQGLQNNKSIQLVDVRTDEEYNASHLENALHLDINGSEFEKLASYIDKNKPVYVYCLSGGRSKKASQWFVNQGFTSVFNLYGGISAWEAQGKKLAKADIAIEDKISKIDFEKLIQSDTLVMVSWNAKWCPPCQKMIPEIEVFKKINKSIFVAIIEATENHELAKRNKVSGYPTIVVYKLGKEVMRNTDFLSANELNAKVLILND